MPAPFQDRSPRVLGIRKPAILIEMIESAPAGRPFPALERTLAAPSSATFAWGDESGRRGKILRGIRLKGSPMGARALQVRRQTMRTIRSTLLSESERAFLRDRAAYEGSPYHKKNPGDFGLTPPAAPRPDKTLCDEAGVLRKEVSERLFQKAIDGGLVSETVANEQFPKQLWVVDEEGAVFEAMYGGSRTGHYHGYPIRRSDPFFQKITKAWSERE